MSTKTLIKTRHERIAAFKSWREKHGLTVEAVVNHVNIANEKAVLGFPQVMAWDQRGNKPDEDAVRFCLKLWRDFPL